jgi:hypothetical protein
MRDWHKQTTAYAAFFSCAFTLAHFARRAAAIFLRADADMVCSGFTLPAWLWRLFCPVVQSEAQEPTQGHPLKFQKNCLVRSSSRRQSVLRGHSKPANEGHFKTGQRE